MALFQGECKTAAGLAEPMLEVRQPAIVCRWCQHKLQVRMKKTFAILGTLMLSGVLCLAADKLDNYRAAVSNMMNSTPVTISTTDKAKLEVVKEVAATKKLKCDVNRKGETFEVTVSDPSAVAKK